MVRDSRLSQSKAFFNVFYIIRAFLKLLYYFRPGAVSDELETIVTSFFLFHIF